MQNVQKLSGYAHDFNWKIGHGSTSSVTFKDKLNPMKKTEGILQEFESHFGLKIDVQSIGKNKKDVLNYATSAGASPIVIAPNILEKMGTDEALKERIKGCIQSHMDSIPYGEQYLAARGRQLTGSGIIVHEDGTVTTWCTATETPEEKERIRRQMEAQEEEKLARKEAYTEASEKYWEQMKTHDFYAFHGNLDQTSGHLSNNSDYNYNHIMLSNLKNKTYLKINNPM